MTHQTDAGEPSASQAVREGLLEAAALRKPGTPAARPPAAEPDYVADDEPVVLPALPEAGPAS